MFKHFKGIGICLFLFPTLVGCGYVSGGEITKASKPQAVIVGPTPAVAPSSLTLQNPVSSPATNTTPTITVSGVTAGDFVQLFSDATCLTQKASAVAVGTSINLTSSALVSGSYTFYARTTPAAGLASACSIASVNYTLDLVAPTAGVWVAPAANTYNNTTNYTFQWAAGTDAGSGLAATPYFIQIYDQAACAGAVAASSTQAGTSYAFTPLVNGTIYSAQVTVTDAAGNSAISACSNFVTYSNPTKLVVAGVTTASAGTCNAYTITTQDPSSAATIVGANLTVNLTKTGTTGQFFANNADCGTQSNPITSTIIAVDTSAKTIYFRDTIAATVTLTAQATAVTDGTLNLTISALAASKMALTGPSSSIANGCSTAMTLTSQDTYGNTAAVPADRAVVLSSGSATIGYYSDSGCTTPLPAATATILNATSAVSFYAKDSVIESVTITATTAVWANKTLAFDSQFVLKPTAANTVAGNCFMVTISSLDANNNPINPPAGFTFAPAAYREDSPGISVKAKFDTNPACIAPYATGYSYYTNDRYSGTNFNFVGNSMSYYMQLDTTGSYCLGVKSVQAGVLAYLPSMYTWLNGGCNVDPVRRFTVSNAVTTQLVVTGPSYLANNTCSSEFRVTTTDSIGNPFNVAVNTTINLTGTAGTTFYSDAGCTVSVSSVTVSSGTQKKVFYLKSTDTPSYAVNAAAAGYTSGSFTVKTTAPTNFKMAASGLSAYYVVNNQLYGWGDDNDGQLGDNATNYVSAPVIGSGLGAGVTDVVAATTYYGIYNAACAVQSGSAYCWGSNLDGWLGDNTQTNRLVPTQVQGLTSGVSKIDLGTDREGCAIQSGALKCWGRQYLGTGTTAGSNSPVSVVGLGSSVTDVALGWLARCAIQSNLLYCWGNNSGGSLGDGTLTSRDSIGSPVFGSGVVSKVSLMGHHDPNIMDYVCAIHDGQIKCWGAGNANPHLIAGLPGGTVSDIVVTSEGWLVQAFAVVNGQIYTWYNTTETPTLVGTSPAGVTSLACNKHNRNGNPRCFATTATGATFVFGGDANLPEDYWLGIILSLPGTDISPLLALPGY